MVIRAIGTGGRVFLVRQLTTAKCFSMVMHGYTGGNDKNSKESVVREVKLLAQQLQHPHILGIRDWFFHANNRLCLIVDFASGGTLELKIKNQSDKLGRFQEAEVMHMAVQLLMALDFIHDRKILHR